LTSGIFLVSLATLALELLLTRVWSVLTFYHFAFVAVSLAMFGLTVGAILVYRLPGYFARRSTEFYLSASALLFSVSLIFSFMTELCVPFVASKSIVGLYLAGFLFCVASLPFCFSGICIALAFTCFSAHIGKLYAADLAGAAVGCLFFALALSVSDGPTAIFLTAGIAALAAYLFAEGAETTSLRKWALILAVSAGAFAYANAVLAHGQKPLISFLWSRGQRSERPVYEKWNPFSRVTVMGDLAEASDPHGWGLSTTYKPEKKIKQLWLELDSFSQTPITEFSGDFKDLDFLKYDVTNFVYHLKQAPRVFIVGFGGGRDLLSALSFGARSVTAADINPDIIGTVNGRFGDFSGHLDRDKRVKFAAEDARSFITRYREPLDIIQISVIDTGVASGSGALALTENSLYTVEAWTTFLKRLAPDGIISCTRWYSSKGPGEIERLVAVARAALLRLGVKDPRRHIVVVSANDSDGNENAKPATAVLVSPQPLSDAVLDAVSENADRFKFEVLLSPRKAATKVLDAVVSGTANGGRAVGTFVNLEPPTDDSPFFFYMLRPLDLLLHPDETPATSGSYLKAEFILAQLLIVVATLTGLCIFVPLWSGGDRQMLKSGWSYLLYFCAIGFGFIFVEISQMQRLIIFLGHPTYSVTVVLFTLLLASGIGSYLTQKVPDSRLEKSMTISLAILLVLMALYWLVTPAVLERCQFSEGLIRVSCAAGILFPLGVLMGMAFPLGFRLAGRRFERLKPWFWGVNGAASTCGSVLSVAVAIGAGLSAAYTLGFACYLVALATLLWSGKAGRLPSQTCLQNSPNGS
jgi:MFS family permease